MKNVNKGLGLVVLLGLSAALTGCGEGSDELKEQLNHDAKMSFVNSLDYMADFHAKKRSISSGYSGLFDSGSVVSADVPAMEVGKTYSYSYKAINNMINLGVKDSNSGEKQERMNTTLKDGASLWVIAWEADGERSLSVVGKKQENKADVFNVRLFANGSYDVMVGGEKVTTTEKGQVTAYYEVSSCADGLEVAGNAIDLCNGDVGQSYLLVVDANGKRVMAAE
ncbi:hypothetical protein L1285_02235 [Pseudoalteromonas sp. DL2-H2.2]|uniref:hypothetical protein n=1 Tax=Pseudoalteromonas sp. DL2-H2.2 TaxID=2908889 RepID=UPI001F2BFFF2|nr:hypothetical protein [Pseudoalteromonas sp. DL2-H2.2]MCF2907164.1 hypothetical protein [Pseudoalteromonas sp. DL2-H2.2]